MLLQVMVVLFSLVVDGRRFGCADRRCFSVSVSSPGESGRGQCSCFLCPCVGLICCSCLQFFVLSCSSRTTHDYTRVDERSRDAKDG